MSQKFDNMIQVLAYFADQCDMFKPMLDGMQKFHDKNKYLDEKIKLTDILHNRVQLNATYSADYANFGLDTVKMQNKVANGETVSKEKELVNINPTVSDVKFEDMDLYILAKEVIKVGKDNYDKAKMENMLDFYSMSERLNMDKYMELISQIEEQHNPTIVDSGTSNVKEESKVDEIPQ